VTTDPSTITASPDAQAVRPLLIFFALVYVVEGLGQVAAGLIAQPLNYYLKTAQGYSPFQITAYIALFNLPWIIKPVYGLVSDFLPLFGYRRRSYLILANIAAVAGYAWAAFVNDPGVLVLALMTTAYAMAISSTLCGAVLVENGQRLHESGTFVNQQWLWFNIAAMAAAIGGGLMVQYLTPSSALHMAALIVAAAPLAVIVATTFLISEPKSTVNLDGIKATLRGLTAAFRRRELWIVAAFIFLYYFSPGLSTPLYFHMTDTLKFPQAYIGILNSIAAAGWVVSALIYPRYYGRFTLRAMLNLSILFGVATTLSYLLLVGETSAAIVYFLSGVATMLATVATLTLAADFCPPRAEGFAFAVLMSIINLANTAGDNLGSFLYTRVLDNSLPPLIIISAAFTGIALVLVPLLRLGDKRQGEPVTGALLIAAQPPEPSRSAAR
jgi:MFS family permease